MSRDASKRYEPLASCLGKQRFESFNDASKVNGRTRRSRIRRQVYRCANCGGYHLGQNMK